MQGTGTSRRERRGLDYGNRRRDPEGDVTPSDHVCTSDRRGLQLVRQWDQQSVLLVSQTPAWLSSPSPLAVAMTPCGIPPLRLTSVEADTRMTAS
jgi:hypothetical protein